MLLIRELSNSKFAKETCNENNVTGVAKQICLNEYRLQKTLGILWNKNKANTTVKHVQSVQTILNMTFFHNT